MIYRVTVKTTNSLQPSGTHWNREVVYCGTDKEEARIAYLKHEAEDWGGSYGNRSKLTIIEGLDSDPDELDDTSVLEDEEELVEDC